jgi:hypothetical protein
MKNRLYVYIPNKYTVHIAMSNADARRSITVLEHSSGVVARIRNFYKDLCFRTFQKIRDKGILILKIVLFKAITFFVSLRK